MWCGELGRKAYHGECTCNKKPFAEINRAFLLEKEQSAWVKIQKDFISKPKVK